jgi:hypothetical protein
MAVREDSTYYSGGGGLLGGGGAADTNCVLVEMDGDGGNERVLMELGREVTPRINVSPGGTYFALHEGFASRIQIYRKSDMTLVGEINHGVDVFNYDWSPDEKYLAVGGGGGSLYTVPGSLDRVLTVINGLSGWKGGQYIAGYTASDDPRYLKMVTESDVLQTDAAGKDVPNLSYYFPGGADYFGGTLLGGYKKVRISDFTVLETYEALGEGLPESPEYEGYMELNPSNGTEVLYSKVIGTIRIKPFMAVEGIYVIGLDGENNRAVRKASYE